MPTVRVLHHDNQEQQLRQLIQRGSHWSAQHVAASLFACQTEKKRKDYTFWRQFHEKPSIIPGCPGYLPATNNTKSLSMKGVVLVASGVWLP